jgi:hypothetical protein
MEEEQVKNQEEENETQGQPNQPKISFGEMLPITIAVFLVDVFDILGDLAAGLVFLLPLTLLFDFFSLIIMAIVQFFLFIKGVKGLKSATFLISAAADFIPLINILPLKTAGWLLTVYLVNHPDSKLSKINQVGSIK